jgi:hypothetical protein
LCGEVGAVLDGTFTGGRAGSEQLSRGALGERLETHRREHLVGGAQLLASVQAPALASQPFAVDEMGAGVLHVDAGAAQPVDRLAIQALRILALREQRS